MVIPEFPESMMRLLLELEREWLTLGPRARLERLRSLSNYAQRLPEGSTLADGSSVRLAIGRFLLAECLRLLNELAPEN